MGKSKQPLTFDAAFFERLLYSLGGKGEIRIGSKFDDPGPDSLGEWIQKDQKIAMNPAVYIGGLLVDGGYAECARRGWIRIFAERRKGAAYARHGSDDSLREGASSRAELQSLIDRLTEEQLPPAVEAIERILEREGDVSPFESLREDPAFILPSAPRRSVGSFEPIPFEGRPLSRDVIEDRR